MPTHRESVLTTLKAATKEKIDALFFDLREGSIVERREAAGMIGNLLAWAYWQREKVPDFLDRLPHNALDVLLSAIKENRDAEVIYRCIACLQHFGVKASVAEDMLVDFLSHKNLYIRMNAIIALGYVSHNSERILPLMLHILRNDNPGNRTFAIRTINEFVPLSDDYLNELLRLVEKERDEGTKDELIRLLAKHGPKVRSLLPYLRKLLKHKSFVYRAVAAPSIFRISDSSEDHDAAAPLIEEILKSCTITSKLDAIESSCRYLGRYPEIAAIIHEFANGQVNSPLDDEQKQIQQYATECLRDYENMTAR